MNAALAELIQLEEVPLTETLIEEGKALLEANWITSGSYLPDLPLDPDYSRYLRASRAGALQVLTLRVDHVLVGYTVVLLTTSSHHRTVLVAHGEAMYVAPAHRRHARTLLRLTLECARKRGAKRMGWFVNPDHPVYHFLTRHGFEEDEVMLEMVL
jgi:GNAT superfamily N-acetyltransferase